MHTLISFPLKDAFELDCMCSYLRDHIEKIATDVNLSTSARFEQLKSSKTAGSGTEEDYSLYCQHKKKINKGQENGGK